jgi:cell division transport system permease protein
MIALTGLALMIAIGLICRAVMATERDTVELLHVMGAADGNIARHFQSHAWRLAWPAALAGFALAVLNLVLLLFFIRHVVDLSSLQIARWFELTVLVVIVPLAAVGAAALSARYSVIRLLRSLP